MRCNSRFLRCSPSSSSTTSSSVSISIASLSIKKNQFNISWTKDITNLSSYYCSLSNLISITINSCRTITGNIMQGLNINNLSVTTVAMLVLVIFQFLLHVTYAGPLNVRHHRTIRETYKELETTPKNETPETPSGSCLLDGQTIPKTSVTCEKKPGCRAIQKTGYCCPEYQCECERDGKTYSDGAKLDKIDPCNFCSCRGGEIVCSTVTCYNRDDCEPKFINGTCCPVYDNCPLIDTKSTTTPSTSTTEGLEHNSKLPTQIKPEMMPKLNITIKEITKKEEIRIVGQNNPKIDDLINVKKDTSENKLEIPDTIIISTVVESQKIVRQTSGSNDKNNVDQQSTTTNKNDIDLISEITNTENNNKEKSTILEQVTEQVIIIDKDGQSKTIQVFDTKGLQRGDIAEDPTEMLISPSEIIYDNTNNNNMNNTNSSTDFSTFSSDSSLNDSYLDLIPNASSDVLQIIISSTTESSDNSSLSEDNVYDTILYNGDSDNLLFTNSSSDEENIYETIYHENDNNQTIINDDQLLNSTSSVSPIDTDNNYQIGHNVELEYDAAAAIENPAYPVIKDEDLSNYQREIENEDYPEGIQWTKSGTISEHHQHHHHLHHQNQHHNQLKEEPRSSMEISTSSSSTTENPLSEIISNITSKSLDNIQIDNDSLLTEGSADDFETFYYPESRAPGEPCLLPEWERNITTNLTDYRCNNTISSVIISDNDDIIMYGMLKNNETEDTWRSSSESIELDLGSGSGMGMIMQQQKDRESTTTRHTNNIINDIDEVTIIDKNNNNNDSSLHSDNFNPKDDAESVKYDDDSNNNSRSIEAV